MAAHPSRRQRWTGALIGLLALLGSACGVIITDAPRDPTGTRWGTAATLAEQAFDTADVAVVTTGVAYADALAAAPLAAAEDAPILLAAPSELPSETVEALDDLEVDEVVVLGGEAAVGPEVVDRLREEGYEVRREAGGDRYATAARAARLAFPDGAETAIVATGTGFADALAAAPLATAEGAPILLTAPDEVPEATAEALDALGVSRVLLLGGEAAIGPAVEAALDERFDVGRHAGTDRYETAALVAREVFPDGADDALIVTGAGFADALAAAPLAADRDAPILLTAADSLPDSTAAVLGELGVDDVELVGGTDAIGIAVEDALVVGGYDVERLAG